MVKFIAHRGNWDGPNPEFENKIEYLEAAYNKKYNVECDLIGHKGKLYFGHDVPGEPAKFDFLVQPGVFCHAKNLEGLLLLSDIPGIDYFWHEKDTVTITSRGYFWCYPGAHPVHNRAIWLDLGGIPLPENTYGIYGICGDNA